MKYRSLLLVGAFAMLAGLAACGGGGGGGGSDDYWGTSSPGDTWDWAIGTASFRADNTTLGYFYRGAKTVLPSGFLKFLVNFSDDPDILLPATAFAMEFPGMALVIKPAGDGPAIVAAGLGACPTANDSYNWVTVPRPLWDSIGDDAYGTADATITTGVHDFAVAGFLLDGTAQTPSSENGYTCSGGILTPPGAGPEIAVTPGGTFVGDNGPNDGGFVGMIQPATNILLADITAAEYRGVLFRRTLQEVPPTSGNWEMVDETEPIGARPHASLPDTLVGFGYVDIETNVEEASTVTLALTGQPAPGLVTGVITDDAGPHSAVFAVNVVGGRFILFGISTDGDTDEPYNFFLIEKI